MPSRRPIRYRGWRNPPAKLPRSRSPEPKQGPKTPFLTRLTMVMALRVLLAIAVFVVREFWLGMLVLVGGDPVVFLLFRYLFRWPWSRIRHGREPG